MNVVVLANPKSGRGRGSVVAGGVAGALRAAGHDVRPVAIGGEAFERELSDALAWAGPSGLLVICGGDGTVHHTLPAAVRACVPVYQIPMGTENLFARQFGMDARPERLVRAVARGETRDVDLGEVGDGERSRLFAIMCSVGPDAAVIHRLSRARTGAISHLSYARPILAELRRLSVRPLRITVDGEAVVDGACGFAVVANSSQYAVRLDPCPGADVCDGKLDLVFLPCRTPIRALGWAAMARLRLLRGSEAVHARGRAITIETLGHEPVPVQVDGEAPGVNATTPEGFRPDGAFTPVTLRAKERALRVLVPPQRP